jgi:uncharacterized protein (TIGR03435 family)
MTPVIRAMMNVLLAVSGSLVASILVKVTATTALALVGAQLARRCRAAIRHVFMASAFAALLALPIASLLVPSVPIGVVPAAQASLQLPSVDARTAPVLPTASNAPAIVTPAIPHSPTASLSVLLRAGWIVGAGLFLVPMVIGLSQMRSLRRTGQPWARGQSVVDRLAADVGIRRRVEVRLHRSVPGPMTCGVVRPAIMLPVDSQTWPSDDLNRAIVHELEHVQRGDWASQCVARAICASYWFHPLVWVAWRQLQLEAERACDDAVLACAEATAYADQLVVLAKRLSSRPDAPLPAMASRGDLAARVTAVLDNRQPRGQAGPFWLALAGAVSVLIVVAISPLQIVTAQTPTTRDRLTFEVASIKPSPEQPSPMTVRPLHGRLIADASVRLLMRNAYNVQPFQIVGGPDWNKSDRFAIEAKADANASRAEMFLMLQALLEDRFQLKTHRETRELPVYTLVAARSGLKLPPPKEGGCVVPGPDAPPDWSEGRMFVPGQGPPSLVKCGSVSVGLGIPKMQGGKISMPEFIRALSAVLGRAVIDKTGFTGLFDVRLDFLPDETTVAMPPPPPDVAASPESGSPSILTALQEQLGLRLESTRGPVEVLVIDSVARPTED